MDSVRIIITKDCNQDGTGGTVVDDATSVLAPLPNGTSLLDTITAAFQDAYGIHTVEDVPVSLYRNFAYRVRMFVTEIVTGYVSKLAAQQAAATAQQTAQNAMAAVTVINNVGE
jgi:ribonuclease I